MAIKIANEKISGGFPDTEISFVLDATTLASLAAVRVLGGKKYKTEPKTLKDQIVTNPEGVMSFFRDVKQLYSQSYDYNEEKLLDIAEQYNVRVRKQVLWDIWVGRVWSKKTGIKKTDAVQRPSTIAAGRRTKGQDSCLTL